MFKMGITKKIWNQLFGLKIMEDYYFYFTGSKPPLEKGWHRPTLLNPKNNPLIVPYLSTAWYVY